MADRSLPDALSMRELRAGLRPESERERVAAQLRAEGRATQALLLYDGRSDHPALEAEQARAAQVGQVFLLLSMRRLGRTIPDEQLRSAAAVAASKGHALEARLAYQALGEVEAVRALAADLPPSLVPPPLPPPTAPPATTSSH